MTLKRRKVRFNYHDYCLLSEGDRRELIDGEFYVMASAPTPLHQTLLLNLAVLLRNHVNDLGLGIVMVAPLDVILSDEDVVQPDILFVAQARRDIISGRGCEGPPDLVVEVLSPGTAGKDRDLKPKLYASYGVQEYWLVDPESDNIEVLSLDRDYYMTLGVFLRDGVLSSRALAEIQLELGEVFE